MKEQQWDILKFTSNNNFTWTGNKKDGYKSHLNLSRYTFDEFDLSKFNIQEVSYNNTIYQIGDRIDTSYTHGTITSFQIAKTSNYLQVIFRPSGASYHSSVFIHNIVSGGTKIQKQEELETKIEIKPEITPEFKVGSLVENSDGEVGIVANILGSLAYVFILQSNNKDTLYKTRSGVIGIEVNIWKGSITLSSKPKKIKKQIQEEEELV